MLKYLVMGGVTAALVMTPAAQAAGQERQKPIGELTLHDFAAKWMMQQDDLADVGRYRDANQALIASGDQRPRVVMMGDSITYHWSPVDLPQSTRLNLVNRGIPGQNSSQMLLRFEDDVIALKPVAVIILAGTNDLRAYVGDSAAAAPTMMARLVRNITAMADIAEGRGVKVILGGIPPIAASQHGMRDPATIVRMNDWLKSFAASRGYAYADYHAALCDDRGRLSDEYAKDGLHPNSLGYRAMRPYLEQSLVKLRLLSGPR